MSQNQNRNDDMPNRSSNMEQAEGSRENVMDNDNAGGITNRPLDEEQNEQEQVPPRGERKDEDRNSER